MKKFSTLLSVVLVWGFVVLVIYIVSPDQEDDINWVNVFNGLFDLSSWCGPFMSVGGIGLFLFSLYGFFSKQEDAKGKAGKLFHDIVSHGAIIFLLLSIVMMGAGFQGWC
jgi:hypothetical protein